MPTSVRVLSDYKLSGVQYLSGDLVSIDTLLATNLNANGIVDNSAASVTRALAEGKVLKYPEIDAIAINGRALNIYDDILINLKTPIIVASLAAANAASYTQEGNLITVDNGTGHSFPATGLNGNTIYLPIVTVSVGDFPKSEITNFFTNFQYVSANIFTCEATNNQTGSGFVNTNISATILSPVQQTINPGSMSNGDNLIQAYAFTNDNSAGFKTLRTYFNSSSLGVVNNTTATSNIGGPSNIMGAIKFNRQITGNGVQAHNLLNSNVVAPSLHLSAVNDYMCLEMYRLYIKKVI